MGAQKVGMMCDLCGINHLFVFFSCFSIEEQQIGILHDLTP